MNTDACFERIKLRNVFDTVEITPKIAINQKNGSDDENIHVDDLLYYFNRYYKRWVHRSSTVKMHAWKRNPNLIAAKFSLSIWNSYMEMRFSQKEIALYQMEKAFSQIAKPFFPNGNMFFLNCSALFPNGIGVFHSDWLLIDILFSDLFAFFMVLSIIMKVLDNSLLDCLPWMYSSHSFDTFIRSPPV